MDEAKETLQRQRRCATRARLHHKLVPSIVVNETIIVGNSAEQGYHQTRRREACRATSSPTTRATGSSSESCASYQKARRDWSQRLENEAWRTTGDVSSWAPLSADAERGIVYVPTNSATQDMYGGLVREQHLRATSIIALDVKTGKRLWHYQMVHHDVWNYDTPTAPIVMDVNVGGRQIPACSKPRSRRFCMPSMNNGRADLGIRGTARACVESTGRETVADAAVPHQPRALRVHRSQRRAPDRLHARDQGARATTRDAAGTLGATVQSTDASRERREGRTGQPGHTVGRTSLIRPQPTRRQASSTFRRTTRMWITSRRPGKELDCFGQTGTTVTVGCTTSAGCSGR